MAQVVLDVHSIDQLVEPRADNLMLQALTVHHRRSVMLRLTDLRNRLEVEAPTLARATRFLWAFDFLANATAETQAAVLGYPTANVWLGIAGRLLDSNAQSFGEHTAYNHFEDFARFAVAAAFLDRRRIVVPRLHPDVEGNIALPGAGHYLHICPARPVTLTMDETGHTFAEDTLRNLAVECRLKPVPKRRAVEVNCFDHALRISGDNAAFGSRVAKAVDHDRWTDTLERALSCIDCANQQLAAEICGSIRALVPVEAETSEIRTSATFMEAPGLISLSFTSNAGEMAETLVHEYFHHKLNLVLRVDHLVTGPTTAPCFYSPWRYDMRPPVGMLHGAFAFLGVVKFWVDAIGAGHVEASRETIPYRVHLLASQVGDALGTLHDHVQFTRLGSALVAKMEALLAQCRARLPSLDASTEAKVKGLLAEHFSAWAERNYPATNNGQKSARANHNFLRCLREGSLSVRTRAIEALRYVQDYDPDVTVGVVSALRDEGRSVRWRAVEVLRRIGAQPEIVDALIDCLGDKDHWVSWHAARALTALSAEPGVSARLAERLLGEELPEVRRRLVQVLGEINGTGEWGPALTRALGDTDPGVRTAAARELIRDSASTRMSPNATVALLQSGRLTVSDRGFICEADESTLRSLLRSEDAELRISAAVCLTDRGIACSEGIPILMDAVTSRSPHLQAWNSLVSQLKLTQDEWGRRASAILPSQVMAVLPEAVAHGILPTIGLKRWDPSSMVEFPSREHRWRDLGVFHSWESHKTAAPSLAGPAIPQVCIYGDWFRDVHLIVVAHMSLAPWDFDVPVMPPSIEGAPVGFIVQSGGHTITLEGMRRLRGPARTDRIDFLYGKDLRTIQYLVFAAQASQIAAAHRTHQEAVGASVWEDFATRLRDLLLRAGLISLASVQWYQDQGWPSSRYHVRYERRYSEIRPGIESFFGLLRSGCGQRFKTDVGTLVKPLLDRLEMVLWIEHLRTYPESLLQFLSREATRADVRQYAGECLQLSGPADSTPTTANYR